MNALTSALDVDAKEVLPELEAIYKDLHRNPELSMQEVRTAGIAADYLAAQGFEVSRQIGLTGVVGVLKNGEGPTVMLRADMDALPVTEATGLPYASTIRARDEDGIEVGVAHACGHDMHVTWLMGAARLLSRHRDVWKGTVLAVFQPGEEVGRGAQGMVDDGMLERFPKPDIILGQHVMVGEAGTIGYRSGVILSAGDSMKVRLFGRGSHGSQPQTSIDPVIMAASTTMRLQTIVSREIAPIDSAVLTIGSLQAGTKENIIPDEATLKLNVRTYDEDVRSTMLSAIKRICCAECAASNAPREPEFTTLSTYPLTRNDVEATEKIAQVFKAQFGERAHETKPAGASEDFSTFGRTWKVPYVFWFVGGTDAQTYIKAKEEKKLNEIPSNHSPKEAVALASTQRGGEAS
ncbi:MULTISPECIES: M20 family metallopeptidase [unclassified Pseudomonas]|uniref:M20 family metallopeptidase n=1 Tax=unclassified Pseudomonas TaxID=196821 RepID=UPI000C86C58F|nr:MULTISPECIES: M20 family metallopeptidase [unclassified Pseudomonas]PMU17566.1 amidohydrolase [Pseudomonas sp. GP01-A9]PMU27070.1 amidohydrolase [Pseudomonas sp. GP01-A13]PMU36009.1 amidohydrolase [Pseudomonas sp. GP01-A8]PMU46277.1 amidohydrolase [Pseudomonas sp. GP01-A14]PMU50731.1 amidohydrolase [Pseudomonas sp. GP01-A6]